MRPAPSFLQYLLSGVCALGLTSTAQAFDPNEGALAPLSPRARTQISYRTLPQTAPQPRYVAPQAAVAVAPAPAPVQYASAPSARQVPVEQNNAYATQSAMPAYTAPAPVNYPVVPARPVYESQLAANGVSENYPYAPAAATAYTPSPNSHYSGKAFDANRYSAGLEIFYDRYEEPDTFPSLGVDAYYAALTGSMTHYFNPAWFGQLEGRASYGRADYSSNSGEVNGISDYEFDARVMGGYDLAWRNGHLKPYAGFGTRLYLDYFKDENIPGTYDRRILQFYAPIGITYEFMSGAWTLAPTIEMDPLLYGYVQSRLQSVGLPQADNTQTSGLGWRAEFLFSKLKEDGSGWQFGPFVRYWDIDDSDVDSNGTFEPRNTRLQAGAKMKLLF